MAEMKTLWHKADEDADWLPVTLHAVDASHALEVDSAHWKQEKPEAEPAADPVEVDPSATTEQTAVEGTEQ